MFDQVTSSQRLRVVIHFLKTIVKYDIALSFLGLSLSPYDSTRFTRIVPFISGLLIRFSIMLCSVGYAVSVIIYLTFKRYEVPLYLNSGLFFRQVVLA